MITRLFTPLCPIPTCRYGCEKKPSKDTTPVAAGLPVPGSIGGLGCVPARHQERIFPLMLALNAPDLFSYRACNFKVQKSKAGTGRVVGFRELGLVNAYTMEASFAGAAVGKYAKQHFNAGVCVCGGLLRCARIGSAVPCHDPSPACSI